MAPITGFAIDIPPTFHGPLPQKFHPRGAMKSMIPCLLIIMFAALNARAEVIVYKKTQKARIVGQSLDLKISATGFLILDASDFTGHTVTVYNFHGDKFFNVTPSEDGVRRYSVTGAAERTHTVLVGSGITNKVSGFEDGTEFSIGTDATLAISPTNSVRWPRVFKSTFGGITVPSGYAMAASYGTGVASYSQKETWLANSLGETVDDTLARHRTALLDSGYREVSE